jgi:glutamyl-tRNA synthetase
MARRAGGTFVVRMEDLDRPRVVSGSAERILEDLAWLGCTWDEKHVQSERIPMYERALERLTTTGTTYPCDCSRAEIALVASAPHGDEVVYPGTCRDKDPKRAMRRPPALRFRAPGDIDDFVLRRGDGVFAYQLAVSVDDLAMAITCVVRGADLAPSTPRQLAIMWALGAKEDELPTYVHLPLVVDSSGAHRKTHGGRSRPGSS